MMDNREIEVLLDLKTIMQEMELPMLLVGAGARILVFDRRFGEGRRTSDLDIALPIESWETYRNLALRLTADPAALFKLSNVPHRFTHIATEIEVDIVPFGKIGEPDQEIQWPESGNLMSVMGFSEALRHAKIEIINGLEIPVVDIPAFVVLKIFAWSDRGQKTRKDLDDLELVMNKYTDDERAYDELVEELSSGAIDFLDASIYLLGQDIRDILEPPTLAALAPIMQRLIDRLPRNQPHRHRVQMLQKGIMSTPTKSSRT